MLFWNMLFGCSDVSEDFASEESAFSDADGDFSIVFSTQVALADKVLQMGISDQNQTPIEGYVVLSLQPIYSDYENISNACHIYWDVPIDTQSTSLRSVKEGTIYQAYRLEGEHATKVGNCDQDGIFGISDIIATGIEFGIGSIDPSFHTDIKNSYENAEMEISWEDNYPYLFGVWLNIDGYLDEPALASYGFAIGLEPMENNLYSLKQTEGNLSFVNIQEDPTIPAFYRSKPAYQFIQ